MNALTTTKSKKVRDVAASVRDWIASDGQSTTKEAKTGAQSALKDARKARANAESAVKEAKSGAESAIKEAKRARATAESAVKQARRAARKRMTRARVAAARTTASRPEVGGKKAIAAAGALGAAGAYFLDPQSGTRRRHMLRDKAEAIVRKVTDRVRRQKDYRVRQAEGKVEALKSKAGAEKPAANDQDLADRDKSAALSG